MSRGDANAQDLLATATRHAGRWLDDLPRRRVPAAVGADDVAAALGRQLPPTGAAPGAVLERLVAAVEPGLLASGSGRFYGWVMGGSLPVALAADWMVSAWDQNAGMRDATPGVVAVEEVAAAWLLELLGLPAGSGVGFTTGATTANLTGLAAARDHVLRAAGWDAAVHGLSGSPRVRVLAGAERHSSVDLALRYLGLGAPELVAVDDQGALDAGALDAALERAAADPAPTIVCLQAGNVHSGSFDPFERAVAAARAVGAWVHVDGAFGLWAATSPALAPLVRGLALADSWATDAHKTLNTPYDGGIAVVASRPAVRAAMGVRASYLLASSDVDPLELVPEMSRRARGVPVWAVIASLGADGVRDLVEGLVDGARDLARGLAALPGAQVLHDVVYTQVCVAFETDEVTRALHAALLAEGEVMPSASAWRGRAVLRFSVSSWRTDADDVARTTAAVARAREAVDGPRQPLLA